MIGQLWETFRAVGIEGRFWGMKRMRSPSLWLPMLTELCVASEGGKGLV